MKLHWKKSHFFINEKNLITSKKFINEDFIFNIKNFIIYKKIFIIYKKIFIIYKFTILEFQFIKFINSKMEIINLRISTSIFTFINFISIYNEIFIRHIYFYTSGQTKCMREWLVHYISPKIDSIINWIIIQVSWPIQRPRVINELVDPRDQVSIFL